MSSITCLTVTLRPGQTRLAALAGVTAVLHARAAEVAELIYTREEGAARLTVKVYASGEAATRLGVQIERRVDVVGVHLPGCASRGHRCLAAEARGDVRHGT